MRQNLDAMRPGIPVIDPVHLLSEDLGNLRAAAHVGAPEYPALRTAHNPRGWAMGALIGAVHGARQLLFGPIEWRRAELRGGQLGMALGQRVARGLVADHRRVGLPPQRLQTDLPETGVRGEVSQ